ncbi:MAG TPA: DUF3857 domain-containing protein [Bacteroidales bacterium]|nr:DUF3857 domain-containing protein [Bacteroidales bacterium]
MMKNLTKYLLVLMVPLMWLNGHGQEDALYNKVIHEYTLNDDGSSSFREYKEVKLMSHMAFHRLYGETFVIYDPRYQELKINEAYTIMKDGKRVEVPGNAFNEVLPRDAANAAPYNHLREMVITHTGLEVGSTIYLDYTIITKEGYYSVFMGEENIKDIIPIKEKQIIINIPADLGLQYKMLNLRTAPEIKDGKDIKTYTFTFREVKPYYGGWGVDHTQLPHLFFSAAKDFERAYFPFVAQDAFTFQASPEMIVALQKIKDENNGDLQTALAIQKMVVNEIGTWNLALEYTGFKCRSPHEVWHSNAGTVIEKTILLATLLRQAGLSAVPVAVIPEKYYDQKVGSLYAFRDFVVQLKVDGDFTYLSARHTQSQDMAFDLAGDKLIVLDGAIESIKAYDIAYKNAEIIYNVEGMMDDSLNLTARAEIGLNGSVNPYFSLRQDTSYARRYFPGAQKAELMTLEKEKSRFRLDVEKKGAVKSLEGYMFLDLPAVPNGISSWGYSYIEKDREEGIKLPELIHEQYHFKIEVPAGYELISPSTITIIDNKTGRVAINIQKEGSIISCSREIKINQDYINPGDFAAFNELWEAWMNHRFKSLVLKKTD